MKSVVSFLAVLVCCAMVRAEDAPPAPKPADPTVAEVKVGDKPAEKKERKRDGPERIYPRGVEIDKLKTELGLTEEQVAKAKEAVAAVSKKNDELLGNKDVAAAEEEVKKAREALKAAEDKAKAAKDNFDLNEEYKKAVINTLPDDKKAHAGEMMNYHPKGEKRIEKKAEKKAEKKGEQAQVGKPDPLPPPGAPATGPATATPPAVETK
jgi:hypothetical protein